jgi:SSS family solute:Na+ symporter
MVPIDWFIIIGYVVLVSIVGFLFVKKASGGVAEFFVAGRNLPWWIAGTSLIATSFACDTPLAVTQLVAEKGIAGNWLWWNQIVVWILAMVFFARLWRRSGLVTDAEFIELRYGGGAGAALRGFKAFYSSVLVSTYTLAWVMLAMQKIVSATIETPAWVLSAQTQIESALQLAPGSVLLWKWLVLIALFLLTTAYTTVSGVWGIMITDLIQMTVKLAGAIMLAVFAVYSVGGLDALHTQLAERYTPAGAQDLVSFLPPAVSDLLHGRAPRTSTWMPLSTFAIFLGVLWWGDCGGFVAQKMFSTRSDRDSTLAAVWYSFIHFAVRPWPWVLVALVALVRYAGQAQQPGWDWELAYPRMIMDLLPAGLRGLMLAGLLAAFMSTVSTQLNWSASYYVNDVYKRFLRKDASERQCVLQSRLATIGFAALAIVVAYYMTSIKNAWVFLFNIQAGVGLVLMLRWFWWRVNVWSELSAMVASLVLAPAILHYNTAGQLGWTDAQCILATAAACTAIWIAVTFLTAPTAHARLLAFYRQVRPHGVWSPVSRQCPDVPVQHVGLTVIAAWLCGVGALCAAMFTLGKFSLGLFTEGAIALVTCVVLTLIAYKLTAIDARRATAPRA